MKLALIGGRARRRVFATVAIGASAMAGVVLPAAAAHASGTILWVSKSAAVGAAGKSCAKPSFNTIQAAVDQALGGQQIKVCAGTYAEQVTVTKSITITGTSASSVQIVPPAMPAESTCLPDNSDGVHKFSLLDVCGSGVQLNTSGLTLAGPWSLPDACADAVYGATSTGDAVLNLSNSNITSIRLADRAGLGGCQTGVGILAGRAAYDTSGSLIAKNVTVSDYQKNGIVVSNVRSNGKLTNTTVDGDPTGLGPDPSIARNGVQFSSNATGSISGGTIRGNECDAPSCSSDIVNGVQSGGVLTFGSGKVSVSKAVITANDIGVLSDSVPVTSSVAVTGNAISDNRYVGVFNDSGTMTVSSDSISGNSVAGLATVAFSGYGDTINLTMSNSTLSGNGKAVWTTSDGLAGDAAPRKLNLEHNIFTGNTDGVVNDLTTIVDAKNSYWDAADGPSVWSFGTGQSVSANVNFFPWSKDAAFSAFAICDDHSFANDVIICGRVGNDTLTSGDTGSTLMLGNGGSDQFRGGAGNDYIIGNSGADFIDGGGGTNYAQGRGGNDTCQNVTVTNRC
jgi:hypothetical protein